MTILAFKMHFLIWNILFLFFNAFDFLPAFTIIMVNFCNFLLALRACVLAGFRPLKYALVTIYMRASIQCSLGLRVTIIQTYCTSLSQTLARHLLKLFATFLHHSLETSALIVIWLITFSNWGCFLFLCILRPKSFLPFSVEWLIIVILIILSQFIFSGLFTDLDRVHQFYQVIKINL